MGGICHPNLNQSLADRMFCPTPYPRLTHSLPSLTLTNTGAVAGSACTGTSASIFLINSQWQTGRPSGRVTHSLRNPKRSYRE